MSTKISNYHGKVSSMNCEYCNKEHSGSYGSGRFCDDYCAKGFTTKSKRKEINTKVSKLLLDRGFKLTPERIALRVKNFRATKLFKYKIAVKTFPWDMLSVGQKIHRVLIEQFGRCNRCNLYEWLDKPIALEYHHEDGDKYNNSRCNVELLCPNCHSQTFTFRKMGKNKVAEGILAENLATLPTIEKALVASGLSPTAGNYDRAYIILGKQSRHVL